MKNVSFALRGNARTRSMAESLRLESKMIINPGTCIHMLTMINNRRSIEACYL